MDSVQKKISWNLSTMLALVLCAGLLVPAVLAVTMRPMLQQTQDLSPDFIQLTFLAGCLTLVLVIAWRAPRIIDGVIWWFGLSILLGIMGTFVPFGDVMVSTSGAPPGDYSKGFCGQGVPIPVVIWDQGVDYPCPFGLILNPPVVFLLGLILYLLLRLPGALVRRLRARSTTPAS